MGSISIEKIYRTNCELPIKKEYNFHAFVIIIFRCFSAEDKLY